MQEVIRFAFLGLGLGSLYSLASQGLMVIYRGSGRAQLRPRRDRDGRRLRRVGGQGRARPDRRSWPGPPACSSVPCIGALDPPADHAPAAPRLAAGPHRRHARRADRAAGRRRAALRLEDHVREAPSCPVTVLRPVRHHHLGRPVHPGRHRRGAHRRAVAAATATRSSASPPRRWPRTSGPPRPSGCRPTGSPPPTGRSARRWPASAAILIAPIVQLQVANDDEPRAGRAGHRAGRQLPVVPGRLRRRHADRHRPDRADPLRPHARASPARCRSP